MYLGNKVYLQVAALQYAIDQQVNADRQMERSLKTVLQEAEELAPDLQTIARTWEVFKRADVDYQQSSDPFPSKAVKDDYLPINHDQPQASMPGNCDGGLWQKLLRWYSSKAQSSNSILQMQAAMLELKSVLESVTCECERYDQALAVDKLNVVCTQIFFHNKEFGWNSS